MRSKLLYKLGRYEFWPWYFFFVPLIPIYFYGVLATRRLLYFTATNPGIFMGGFFGEEKDAIMKLIPDKYKVKSILVNKNHDLNKVLEQSNLTFPLIAKPNIGERGYGVKVIQDQDELLAYAKEFDDYLIQEYINYQLELGVLYSRIPGEEKGQVTSITEKKFIQVTGDGRSTVRLLVDFHPRHRLYLDVLERECAEILDTVPTNGEEVVVYRIGNHAKGTKFLDRNSRINSKVNAVFDELNKSVEGVYYGRYDLKVISYEDLESGENIKVFELNGVSSEPGHIYDQSNLIQAHIALAQHWFRIIRIAKENIKKGVKTTPFKLFFAEIRKHFLS